MATSRTDTSIKQWQVVPKGKTNSFVLSGGDSGIAFTNAGATGTVTGSLPLAKPGLGPFYFLVVAAQVLSITPKSTDTIRGLALGAALNTSTVGTLYELLCVVPNIWELFSSSFNAANIFSTNINFAGQQNGIANSWVFQTGQSLSGQVSAPPNGNVSPINLYVSNDTADTTTIGPGLLSLVSVEEVAQTGHTGGRNAIFGYTIVAGTPGATPQKGYCGVQARCVAIANLTGVAGSFSTYAGGIFGGNSDAQCKSGATYLSTVVAHEFDTAITAGANAAEKLGLSIVQTGIDVNRGDFDDNAIRIANQDAASTTWKYGLAFGGYARKWAFGTDSTLIYAWTRQVGSASPSIALNGVDFRNVTFQTGGFAFASTGFTVDPAGQVTATGDNSATGVALTVSGSFTGSATYAVKFSDLNNTSGIGIKMIGNGATTPSKTIRVTNGSMQILNDAGTSTIMQLNDNLGVRVFGTFTVPGASTAMITSAATFTNGAGAGAGTLTNAPAAGNPTSWIAINDNGTTRHFPAW